MRATIKVEFVFYEDGAMQYEYANKRKDAGKQPGAGAQTEDSLSPSMAALRSGVGAVPPDVRGHRVDLPDAMRQKMENAFSADLTAVKIYESQTVADAGAQAVAQGPNIAFAPGMLDFTSFGGQALLGHELSHVVSQARGEVSGGGFLNDSALEAHADREGTMAAAGQQVYAMPRAAISGVSAASAAGPMQAKKDKDAAPAEKTGAGTRPSEGDLARQAAEVVQRRNVAKETTETTDQTADIPATPQDFVTSLGSSNMREGSRFDRMIGSLSILNNLHGLQGSVGGDSADYLLPAYSRAIADMKKYRKELNNIKDKGERQRQKAVIDQVLAQAKADEKRIRAAKKEGKSAGKSAAAVTEDARTVTLQDDDYQEMDGGKNTVYKYRAGYYKANGDGNVSESDAAVMGLGGVKLGKGIDPHQDSRELAAARLDKLLGGNVIVQSQRAQIGEGSKHAGKKETKNGETRTFAAQGTKGILMEEAKGDKINNYNWKVFDPEFESGEDDQSWMARDKDESTNVGQRLAGKGFKGFKKEKSTNTAWTAGRFGRRTSKEGKATLDTADPKLQRDMNAMFLIDSLMQFGDRHDSNFLIEADEKGNYAGLKGIDNDTAFGEKTDMKSRTNERSGLPEQMHIDRAMAEKIKAVAPEQLELIFSDLLTKDEIKAMQTRFKDMSKYIDQMEKKHLVVDKWDEKTAQDQLLMSQGSDRKAMTEKGNTYYQRMMLQAMDKKEAWRCDYYS